MAARMADREFFDPPRHTDYSRLVCAELRASPDRLAAYGRLRVAAESISDELATTATLEGYRRHLLTDQFYLAKWLRVSNYDDDAAVAKLRRHLAWRSENGIDKMSIPYFEDVDSSDQLDGNYPDPEIPELIRRYHTGGRYGSDREGRPVFIDPIGKFDMPGLMRRHSLHEIVLSRVRIWERLLRRDFPAARRRTGLPVCQTVYIIDLAGFGRGQMNADGLAYARELARTMEDNYPELIGAVLVLNPRHWRLTQMIWRLMTPLLPSATRRVVQILPEGEAGRAALLAMVPADQLPAAYGGQLVDPSDADPACPSFICYGGLVPHA